MLVFLPLLLGPLSMQEDAAELRTLPTLTVGDRAPELVVERWLRGEALERLEPGSVYVIDFWATWCGPCIAGMPHLTALQRELGPRGLRVIGVAPRPDEWGHDEASIEALLARKEAEIGYAIALDAEGDSERGYQGVFRGKTIESWMGAAEVGALPIAFVVDRAGTIAAIAPPLEVGAAVRACLDGTFDRERAAREYRALLGARAQLAELEALLETGERDLARTLTEELFAGPLWNDARYLTALAGDWSAGEPDGPSRSVALRAAKRADALSGSREPGTLGLLARLYLANGETDAAERAQSAALALAEGDFRAALERDFAAARDRSRLEDEPASELGAALDELVRVYVESGEFSGSVLVARSDDVLLRKAYGFAEAERGIPNETGTRFHVASLTKTFTSAAVLLLAQEGKLALGDPLARFLPDYPRGNEITLEQLLLHQAGVPDHHGLPGFEERTRGPVSAREMVEFVQPFPLDFAPGTGDRYTNSGYTLLAYVVELASGRAFADFVRERLCAPLGLASTGEAPVAAAAPERALGHEPGRAPRWLEPVPARDFSYAVGSGSLESTVDDLYRWMKALDAKRPVDLFAPSWPYGWGRREGFGRTRFEQTGLHGGFASVMAFYPADDVFVVTLSNVLALGAWRELHIGLARIVLGQDLDWPERTPPVALDDAGAARLTGRFVHPDGFEFAIECASDGLRFVRENGKERRVLDTLGPDRLRLRFEGVELVFPSGHEPSASVDWIQGTSRTTCASRAAR